MVMGYSKFPDIRRFSWESSKQQSWNTTVQKSASGRIRTMTNQLYPAWTIKASYNALTDEEARQLLGFIAERKGRYEPFLWLDPEDYRAKGVTLVNTNGYYQALMNVGGYVEPVEYIEHVTVYVDGVKQADSAYSVEDGAIKFKTAPTGIVTADYTYYWLVHFSEDGITINKIFDNINKASITLAVVR